MINFNRFHYQPSIFGYIHLKKHPYTYINIANILLCISVEAPCSCCLVYVCMPHGLFQCLMAVMFEVCCSVFFSV